MSVVRARVRANTSALATALLARLLLQATDHNLYVHEGHAYEANYAAGLRILKVNDPSKVIVWRAEFFWFNRGVAGISSLKCLRSRSCPVFVLPLLG